MRDVSAPKIIDVEFEVIRGPRWAPEPPAPERASIRTWVRWLAILIYCLMMAGGILTSLLVG